MANTGNSQSKYLCPRSLAGTLSVPRQRKKGGPLWQYHPRSDHHSKVACLLTALDLLNSSEAIRKDFQRGRIAFGINHEMVDHRLGRKKALDLVIHRLNEVRQGPPAKTFQGLLDEYGVVLSESQRAMVDELPVVPVYPVAGSAVYIAIEAKACMTAFGKARPRLYDELNSSHLTIHGDTNDAIAVGLVIINTAGTFISPLLSPDGPDAPNRKVSEHKQPNDFDSVISKINELPRRSNLNEPGFDAMGVMALECFNDGNMVTLTANASIPPVFDYGAMINRVARDYETRFHRG